MLIDYQDIQKVSTGLATLEPIFSSESNIHTYTNTIGQQAKTFFMFDDKYHISSSKTIQPNEFSGIYKEISDFSHQEEKVMLALDSIKTSNGMIESETGLNLQDLLIRTWKMAKNLPPHNNAKNLVINNLQHNYEAGGGCLPGISARLVQPYTAFVKILMEKRFNDEQQVFLATSSILYDFNRTNTVPLYEEDDLELDKIIQRSRIEF